MSQSHNHGHDHGDTGNLRLAFFLNFGFTLLEIVGGLWTNSIAIQSDALHDFGDSISLGVAWYLGKVAETEGDEDYSYGYRRFSLLGALITTAILVGGSLYVLSQAIPRLINPEVTYAPGMVGLAVIGIAVNGLAMLRTRRGSSLNLQAVSWHLLEDLLGWIAVLIVSVVLLFADVPILDPLLSILITLYVLFNVVRRLRKTSALFLQAVPDEVNVQELDRRLQAIAGVQSTHHTHVWSLDGEHHVFSTHLVIDDDAGKADLMRIKAAARKLCDEVSRDHVTIEVEYESEYCAMAPRH
ncbi:MAG TPA: cation diffusion facilitator family transporter [Caldilineaceae bacterium]|nr:cation diffusion facilitator family transporter [Caldilineaceae bacterium]